MKYNEEVFSLSKEIYEKKNLTVDTEFFEDSELKKIEDELLKILLLKFKNELNIKNSKDNNGILKVRLHEHFYKVPDDGVKELKTLIKMGKMDSLALDYGIYLVGETECSDEFYNGVHVKTYEIAWDYKTYFDMLKNSIPPKVRKLKSE